MEGFGSLYALASVVMFVVLLSKFDKRYGKIERDIDELRKKMDELLKSQVKITSDTERRQEYSPEKTEREIVTPAPVVEEKISQEPPLVYHTVCEASPVIDDKPLQELPLEEEVILVPEEQEEPVEMIKEEIVEEFPAKQVEEFTDEPEEEEEEEEAIKTPVLPKPKKEVNYEKFIGENLFGKIGILIFVIGIGFFVKYAIDKDWINETMRTVLGFLVGSALLGVAERLQKKYRTFSSLLAGGAFAVFYLTVAIAFHYYHLFTQTTAFVILIGVTVFMTVLSVLYDRRELAITSLVGGFLAPFIVSTGEGSYLVLFTYISILNLGMFGLSIYKKWGELPVISFVFTYLVLSAYVGKSDIGDFLPDSIIMSGHMLIFATLFYFIFLLPVISILRVEGKNMSMVLLSLVIVNNFLYLAFGLTFLHGMYLPFKAAGLLSLFIAIVNLILIIWLRKKNENYKFLIHAMLGLVLTFVSITIPAQLEGNYITIFWASEMVLLLWLYIKSRIRIYEYASFILIGLTFISFLMDMAAVVNAENNGPIFFNGSFATIFYMALALGAFALLMYRHRTFFATVPQILHYNSFQVLMMILSIGIFYFAFMREFFIYLPEKVAFKAMLLFTCAVILGNCFAFRKRFPMDKYTIGYQLAMVAGTLIYVLDVWFVSGGEILGFWPAVLQWSALAVVIVTLYYIARQYHALYGVKSDFIVYLNILSVVIWLTLIRSFLWQIGQNDFSAAFSISLSVAGFVQMGLGMRLHQKTLRIISLVVFGIVLAKLLLIDLWALPTIGKIVVFILLGLILLTLSFLYQKLKNVLFKDDENEMD